MNGQPRTRRPAGAYMLGIDGPSVEVPGWVCDWLERQTNLAQQRVAQRGADAPVDDVLIAIREAAIIWRTRSGSGAGSGPGTSLPQQAQPQSGLTSGAEGRRDVVGVATVAGLVGISDEAVRRACREGRLAAQQVDGRWLIERTDAEDYRQQRAA